MIEALTPILEQERVRDRYDRQGRRERQAPSPNPATEAKLTPAERIVITIIYQWKLTGQDRTLPRPADITEYFSTQPREIKTTCYLSTSP